MNIKDLENVLPKLQATHTQYQSVKKELDRLTSEINNVFPVQEPSWNISTKQQPQTNDWIFTFGFKDGEWRYNVLFYRENKDLYQFWFKLPTKDTEGNIVKPVA